MQQQDKSYQVYSNEQQANLFKSKRKSSNDRIPSPMWHLPNNWQPYSWYYLMTKQTKTQTEDKVDFSIAEKWNGIFAIVGCGALIMSYSLTGQIIPGFV
tara:strand:- start:246 stop:542 length:297 start_codon:yes stop_codon:yes gene_type:complete